MQRQFSSVGLAQACIALHVNAAVMFAASLTHDCTRCSSRQEQQIALVAMHQNSTKLIFLACAAAGMNAKALLGWAQCHCIIPDALLPRHTMWGILHLLRLSALL